MESIEDAIVAVQSEWNGWRTAMVRVAHMENIHWAQPAGAPRPLIHAVIPCDRLHTGQIAHHCELTPPPHRLLVCVLRSHTPSAVFAELARRADAALGAPSGMRDLTVSALAGFRASFVRVRRATDRRSPRSL